MLEEVKWGEFKIGDLFEKIKTNNVIENESGDLPATTAVISNNQIGRYISRENATILKNVFSATANGFGKAFYQKSEFTVLQDSYAFQLKNKNIDLTKIHSFIVCALNKIYSKYDWGNKSGWTKVQEEFITLPLLKNGKINFLFMEEFIAELEATHLAELEAYLSVTGLKDYKLTKEEIAVLDEFEDIKWETFRMGDLFDRLKTIKLPYKAEDLPKYPTMKYKLPCLTSSFHNQGLNYYAPIEGATILKNVISIPSNSDVYRAYFQSNNFTILSDAYAIDWISNKFSEFSYSSLFAVTCINKVTNLPIYSYKNKLGGWNVVKDKNIKLPTNSNQINYKFMQTLISAIQKLVIKDVVLWSEKKISATKSVIEK